ncbi:class I SAM-dependent RNA methyltransferase [Amnibacterium sp.]|uniref:class I SAM-dependent RNA methyltransferase n=1 Tax=Amnibacterium sp. TaxID=1872496 RepID=UPI0026371FFF|nr:class I SAM-dependent RNA methyltransferase [Amnibacterium sp.]
MTDAQGLEGTVLDLDVLRIAHGGVSVAEHEGRVVFVADTLPGERVRARVVEDRHERWLRAETVAVLEPSPDRRPHIWAAASVERDPDERAGGAEFGHIASERQRALKSEVLRDALARTGRLPEATIDALDPQVRAVPGPPDGTRSRTRLRLHVDAGGAIGPYAARSRSVVPVEDLPLGVAPLEALLPTAPRDRDSVELVAPSEGEPFAVGGRGAHPPITERVGERRFLLEATGFWQVHPEAPSVLTAAVQAALDPGRFDPRAGNLDLYGGVGLLAAALGDAGGPGTRVTSVESDRAAGRHARANLASWRGARTVPARVDAFLARERDERPGATVVLDPPRSGAGRAVVEALAGLRPARIVYVACDPVALARDLATFAGHGWRPVHLEAFDLFPNTHHLEAVVALDHD